MTLGTAASIGIGLFQHRKEIASALGGVMGAGKGLGKLVAGEGFGKVAELFDLKNAAKGTPGHASPLAHSAAALPPGHVHTLHAMAGLTQFDTDKSGDVSREELLQGLNKLETSGLRDSASHKHLYKLGEQLLKNYDNVAAQDGDNQSISYRDVLHLAGQDGQRAMLNPADWDKLNA